MATNDYTATNANGVTYALTYTGGIGAHYTLVITYPGGTTTTISDIPPGNVLTSDGTLGSLVSIGANSYVIPPGVSGTFDVTAALLGSSTVYVGGNATIDTTITALSSVTIQDDGGSVTTGTLVGALSGLTVDLDHGGTFTNGTTAIGLLGNTAIDYGVGGGTFVANGGGSLIDLSSLIINGFTGASDHIEFQNTGQAVTSYSIADSGGDQVITLLGAQGEIGSVTIAGQNLATGTVDAGSSGPLTILSNGTSVSFDASPSVLCFLAGTDIGTPGGETPVEALRIGDLVLTADGRAVSVLWVGLNTVSTQFADPLRVLPVRIRAGALGGALPTRDLLVSPDHALFVDGVLIQAGALINGLSITRETRMPQTFVYYHVEVAEHALILAEGVPAETFVDNVDRMAFDNWNEHLIRYGHHTPIAEMAYPRAKSARQVPDETRTRLAAIAAGFIERLPAAA